MKKGAASRKPPATHNEIVPTRVVLRAALAAICLAGTVASVITYVSDVRLQEGVAAARDSRFCPRAVRKLRASASSLNPSALRDVVLAACLLRTGHPAEADRTIARAAAREPANARLWAQLALFQAERGQNGAAQVSYAHARRLDPRLPPRAL